MSIFHSDGLALAYHIDGAQDAPPLVFLNSLGTNLHMWDAQAAALKSDWRVIRYDNRGHGESQAPAGVCTIEHYGRDLLALLDTLQIARAHLCGLSLGGVIVQWVAIHHPERVRSITLANTAARIGSEATWDARVAAVQSGGLAAIREAVLSRFLSEGYRQSHPAVTRQIGEMLLKCDQQGYIAACLALRSADLRSQLPRIQAPALILGCELDQSTPPAQAQELHAALAGSQLHIFPATAHLSNIEHPQEFSERLRAFLQRVQSEARA